MPSSMDTPLQVSFSVAKGRGHFRAVPVESAGQDGLGKIRVGQPVCPLALPLEAACHRVAAQRFLVPAQLVQLGVAVEDIPDD